MDVKPATRKLTEGVYCLYEPDNGVIDFDVVFIHGLKVGSGREQYIKTWSTRDGTQCWAQTWLCQRFPGVRVLSVSYDSSATYWTGKPTELWDNAINCINKVLLPEVGLGNRPYFLVGHSMGGLLAKEILLEAHRPAFESNLQLRDNCKGIVFYGVPHLGANAADFATFVNTALGYTWLLSFFVTEELRLLGTRCYRRNLDFNSLEGRYPTFNFIETLTTYGVMVVPRAVAGFNTRADNMASIEANHFNVCKPSEMTDTNFMFLVNFLRRQLNAGKIPFRVPQMNLQ